MRGPSKPIGRIVIFDETRHGLKWTKKAFSHPKFFDSTQLPIHMGLVPLVPRDRQCGHGISNIYQVGPCALQGLNSIASVAGARRKNRAYLNRVTYK